MRAREGTMVGHGQKLSRKQEALIAALLTQPTRAKAADAAGLSAATVGRWMHDAGFQAAYAEARRQALGEVLAYVQQSMMGAVAVLRAKMLAKDSPAWLQVQCAKHLLDIGLRAVEIEQ